MSRIGALMLSGVLAAGALVFLVSGERGEDPLAVGGAAPPFTLPVLAGPGGAPREVSLDLLRGKVVLLNFWATWCKPCEDEMPAMERLYQTLAPHGLELLAVSVDSGDAEVEAFRERLAVSFPLLRDPQRSVANEYQSYRFPESFLIDRAGRLVARFVGPREWDAPAYVTRVRELLDARGG
jgi:peroxiredoxin